MQYATSARGLDAEVAKKMPAELIRKKKAQALTQSIQHASCNHHFNINFAWINLHKREHSLRTCFSFGGHST
jgi:hypothetical protein